jgi:RNA polymerase sigma factor (sigma-70 family)
MSVAGRGQRLNLGHAMRSYWMVHEDPSRRDLVERARLGDQEAFARLVTAHLDAAWRFVRAVGGDRVDVDDVVQEGFLMAWRDLPALRDPGAFEPWLRGILMHRAHNELRRAGRIRLIPIATASDAADGRHGATVPHDIAGRDPDPGAHVASRDAVARAFARLSAEERALLVLHHLEDWPMERVALALDRPVGTVKSRMYAAREALRAALAAEER